MTGLSYGDFHTPSFENWLFLLLIAGRRCSIKLMAQGSKCSLRWKLSLITSEHGLSFVWLLTGFCGLFCPMCLECDIARHYGECFCWPLLPGSTFALRVGTRERHKIWVSVFECMCEPGSVWEPGCLSNPCRVCPRGTYSNADY